jgi:hypothetical protein
VCYVVRRVLTRPVVVGKETLAIWRKRKSPAPFFKQAVPYDPVSGEYSPIGVPTEKIHIAMFQVIEADTHDNYIVCRGYDPTLRKFLNSINVAKPYDQRGAFGYVVGHVFPAAIPITRLGETSGVSETTIGCPADLNEAIEILLDDDSNPVRWLDISSGGVIRVISGVLDGALDAGGSATMSIWELNDGETDWVNESTDTSDNMTVFAPAIMRSGSIAVGKWVETIVDDDGNWRVRWSECP